MFEFSSILFRVEETLLYKVLQSIRKAWPLQNFNDYYRLLWFEKHSKRFLKDSNEAKVK